MNTIQLENRVGWMARTSISFMVRKRGWLFACCLCSCSSCYGEKKNKNFAGGACKYIYIYIYKRSKGNYGVILYTKLCLWSGLIRIECANSLAHAYVYMWLYSSSKYLRTQLFRWFALASVKKCWYVYARSIILHQFYHLYYSDYWVSVIYWFVCLS